MKKIINPAYDGNEFLWKMLIKQMENVAAVLQQTFVNERFYHSITEFTWKWTCDQIYL